MVQGIFAALGCFLCWAIGHFFQKQRDERTIKALRKVNNELLAEQREGKYVSPSQLAEFIRITQEHAKLNDQQNAIVVFLRDNFPSVGAGKYAGMQFSEMVIAILRECQGGPRG